MTCGCGGTAVGCGRGATVGCGTAVGCGRGVAVGCGTGVGCGRGVAVGIGRGVAEGCTCGVGWACGVRTAVGIGGGVAAAPASADDRTPSAEPVTTDGVTSGGSTLGVGVGETTTAVGRWTIGVGGGIGVGATVASTCGATGVDVGGDGTNVAVGTTVSARCSAVPHAAITSPKARRNTTRAGARRSRVKKVTRT